MAGERPGFIERAGITGKNVFIALMIGGLMWHSLPILTLHFVEGALWEAILAHGLQKVGEAQTAGRAVI